MGIEFITRKDPKSGGAMTSSPGISPPGVNCDRASHEPPYALTFHPGGTSTRYPCRLDSKTVAEGDVDGEAKTDGGVELPGAEPDLDAAGASEDAHAPTATLMTTTPSLRSNAGTSFAMPAVSHSRPPSPVIRGSGLKMGCGTGAGNPRQLGYSVTRCIVYRWRPWVTAAAAETISCG
jgi:hypothetical protein